MLSRLVHAVVAVAVASCAALVGCSSSQVEPIPSNTVASADAGADAAEATCLNGVARCGGACMDFARSFDNCGSCGNACKPGEVCSNGTCALTCAGGATKCGDACTNLKVDPSNCGECGKTCAGGTVCSDGRCATTCAVDSMMCTPDGGTPYCANTQTDNANCGVCGKTCPSGEVCSGGTCALTCGALTTCPAAGGAPAYCANTQTDNANCGVCGKGCASGEACMAGTCTITCGTLTTCPAVGGAPAYCANTQTDNANCGACGNGCAFGLVCSPPLGGGPGSCQLQCTGGTTKCGNACVDTMSDPDHCGRCDKPCGGGEACGNGTCTPIVDCTNRATTATPSASAGGSEPSFGPVRLINGVRRVCTEFSWISNNATSNGAFFQLTWASNQTVGVIYVESEDGVAPTCGTTGRNVASATVQYLAADNVTWVTAGTLSNPGANIRFNLPVPVSTRGVRLFDVRSGPGNGNSVVFEWFVMAGASCANP